jgi:hypothetical protein
MVANSCWLGEGVSPLWWETHASKRTTGFGGRATHIGCRAARIG